MTERAYGLHASMVVEDGDDGKPMQAFAIRLDRQMSTNDVWETLAGALVATYRNALQRQGMTESDFLDQTQDRLERILHQTPGVPTVQ